MKLLVATEFAPNASGGGPAVVRQLLKDWPVSELYWWSCSPDSDRRFGQQVSNHRWAAIPRRLYPLVRAGQLKSALLDLFWVPYALRHLRRTIERFRPDAIWAIPHDWSVPPLHAVLLGGGMARATPRQMPPFHVSVHDYVDTLTNPVRYGKLRAARMARMADELYLSSRSSHAICHEMADDLQKRTGRTADAILRFGVEPEDFEHLANPEAGPQRNEVRIAYAGTIVVEQSFELFANALAQIRSQLPHPVQLHLFGSHNYANRPWFKPEWMVQRGNLPESELRAELRRCDWGFSPMALVDRDPRYNRFSFPTKFIAYLAAGLPVIALGHPESSVMRMALRYRVGLTLGALDVTTLVAQLKQALAEPDPRGLFAPEIARCAHKEFDAAAMRRWLHSEFMR